MSTALSLLWTPLTEFTTSATVEDGFDITFDEPRQMNVVTPGQVAVVYVGDWCLGSGVIAESESQEMP